MPKRSPRPCSRPGCPALVHPPDRACAGHRRELDARRGSSSDRGYDVTWRKFRAWFIRQPHNPACPCGQSLNALCCRCLIEGGRTTAVEEIDHVTPLIDGGERLDPANCQPLCKAHHSEKTARENQFKMRS